MKMKLGLCFMTVLLIFSLTACHSNKNTTDINIDPTKGADLKLDDTNKTNEEESDKMVYNAKLPQSIEKASIYVEKISGISDDFIRGVDISSILSEEESGVVYYNEAGEAEDFFKILADAGVNYVRVRVWNDPYDVNGNGYGGGNCDTARAAEIGKRAAQYGLKMLVDYHYSDFWADPSKQMVPKAWANMTFEEKEAALYEFTKESLTEIIEAGAEVGMVQIGNETNTGMSGEVKKSSIAKLMVQGANAVREVAAVCGLDIQVAIHLTNVEDLTGIDSYMATLKKFKVDYDVVGLSYYPFWHGTLENLTTLMHQIVNNYDKKVMVAETSYSYTLENGDGFANSISEESQLNKNYTASIQSQANVVRDVMAAVAGIGEYGMGVFYWEPAWVPVGVYDYEAEDADAVLANNKARWEKYGSGWASSYSSGYDPKDAGAYFGGSSWDNQAMFDFHGKALASLNVFKYVKYGASSELEVDYIKPVTVNINVGAPLTMPETVSVIYNDRNKNGEVEVTWDAEQLAAIDTNEIADYIITGVTKDGAEIIADLHVALVNFVTNPSFEEADTSMYNFLYEDVNPADFQMKEADSHTGSYSMHFWDEGDVYFQGEQTITDLMDGEYYFNLWGQGGDMGSNAITYIYVTSGGVTYKQEFSLTGYGNWTMPELSKIPVVDGTITVGVYVSAGPGAWGTFDDWYLCKTN